MTQGDYARNAVHGSFDLEQRIPGPEGTKDCQLVVLRLTATHRTLWFHSYHPSAYGRYWSQRNACWPYLVTTVTAFIEAQRAGRPWPEVASNQSSTNRIAGQAATSAMSIPLSAAPGAISGGSGGPLETLVAAFNTVFRVSGRPFSTLHGSYQGVSDDAAGVQWNAGHDRDRGTTWLGVNLEGMAYDGWPIARLIERELARPTFPDLCATLPGASLIEMEWSRDAWQVAARLPIRERRIVGTPLLLDRLTAERWKAILVEAYGCLNPSRGHRGRAQQLVTLKNGRAEKPVSPHLTITHVFWRQVPPSQDEAERAMRVGRQIMEPVHAFVRERSR